MTADEQTVLDERYVLDEVIGRGGMADVYRGTDRLLLRPVAIKVLREVTEPGLRERFIAEARMLASLNHPGLITLLDAGIRADRPYLVMELATGPTLSEAIGAAPLESSRVRRIGRCLAEALDYAHSHGVVHRDVKPSNVLLCDEDRVLLADFGIARLVGAVQHQTKSGVTIGSPAYLSPEQVAGEEVGPPADVYSLGLVLLEALTGVRAYTGAPLEAAMARLNASPIIPTGLESPWCSVIARMTERDPAVRPSAAEVAAELGEVVTAPREHASVTTGDLERTQEQSTRRPRRSLWAAALGGLLAMAALAAVLILVPRNHAPVSDPEPAVPSSVPTRLQQPLVDLHEAVEGHQR